MDLLQFKWIAAFLILLVSIAAGLVSLRFVTKYQRLLQVGDAAANGIFIGAAFFHLLPDAVFGFHILGVNYAFISAVALGLLSFFILFAVDKTIASWKFIDHKVLGAILLTVTLSIHAFLEGLIIGVSSTWKFTTLIFFAVIAHKSFEVFAFVINLHRRLRNHLSVLIILIFFAFITPLGIFLGTISMDLFNMETNTWLSVLFDSFAAGTFFYIGTMHRHHSDYHLPKDSYHQYNEFLALVSGIIIMGLLGIFI